MDPDFIFLSEYFLQLNLWLLVIGKLMLMYIIYGSMYILYNIFNFISIYIGSLPRELEMFCEKDTLFRGEYYQ